MIVYVNDGTFEGLLTSIYDAYYKKDNPKEILKRNDFQYNLIYEPIFIETTEEKYSKVYEGIKHKIGMNALYTIYYSYLSCNPNIETLIYKYVKLGFKIGYKIDDFLHSPTVMMIEKEKNRVLGERHRILGFVRFSLIQNKIYYASIEPDNDILALITPHFANRFKTHNFIINDIKRNKCSIYSNGEWEIQNDCNLDHIKNSSLDDFECMWQTYFKYTNIKERENLKLQKRHMPKRYWKYLIETQQ